MSTTRDKGTKTGFCSSLEWKLKLQWLDKTGIHKLKDGRVVRIELETSGTYETYTGFLVTVMNPKEGKVDQKFFAFSDYLTERSDDRQKDQPGSHFQVIAHTGWRWYIAVPKTTRPFCEAVEAYIKVFS